LASDGSRILTVSDNVATVWDVASGKELAVLRGHTGQVVFASFSRDGSRVVSGSNDHTARIWDAQTGQQIAVLRGHDQAVARVVFSADGSHILTSSDDHSARVWDVRFATTSATDLVRRVCSSLLGGLTELSAGEMALAGYGGEHPIDVCSGQ
jgi:WD40 repeat protein